MARARVCLQGRSAEEIARLKAEKEERAAERDREAAERLKEAAADKSVLARMPAALIYDRFVCFLISLF